MKMPLRHIGDGSVGALVALDRQAAAPPLLVESLRYAELVRLPFGKTAGQLDRRERLALARLVAPGAIEVDLMLGRLVALPGFEVNVTDTRGGGLHVFVQRRRRFS